MLQMCPLPDVSFNEAETKAEDGALSQQSENKSKAKTLGKYYYVIALLMWMWLDRFGTGHSDKSPYERVKYNSYKGEVFEQLETILWKNEQEVEDQWDNGSNMNLKVKELQGQRQQPGPERAGARRLQGRRQQPEPEGLGLQGRRQQPGLERAGARRLQGRREQ